MGAPLPYSRARAGAAAVVASMTAAASTQASAAPGTMSRTAPGRRRRGGFKWPASMTSVSAMGRAGVSDIRRPARPHNGVPSRYDQPTQPPMTPQRRP